LAVAATALDEILLAASLHAQREAGGPALASA
jgi:hypothetical protein